MILMVYKKISKMALERMPFGIIIDFIFNAGVLYYLSR
jgi:hypothetical protein